MLRDEDIEAIAREHGIAVRSLRRIKGGSDEGLFIVNDELVLRPSARDNRAEIDRFRRIQALDNVPRLRFSGSFDAATRYYYVAVSMLPGSDYLDALSGMTGRQQADLGVALALFLESLHAIRGDHYDIGHYVPVIAGYAGGWKDGHAEYRNFLWSSLDKLALAQESRKILSEAFAYLDAASGALAYEHGAVLLHNDFHPKNIIVSDGAFSGLIDWECSQYGEPDFELCHLVHWCRYPPEPGIDLKPLLRSLFQASPACARTPDLIDRLTIYQIEHEMAQLHWSRGSAERDRIPRLRAWLDREVDAVLGGL